MIRGGIWVFAEKKVCLDISGKNNSFGYARETGIAPVVKLSLSPPTTHVLSGPPFTDR